MEALMVDKEKDVPEGKRFIYELLEAEFDRIQREITRIATTVAPAINRLIELGEKQKMVCDQQLAILREISESKREQLKALEKSKH